MAYTKQTVGPGDVITSSWGNLIQTQYDEALKDMDFLEMIEATCRNISKTYNYTGDKLTSISITGGITATVTYTYTGDDLTQEQLQVTAPYARTVTKTYTISGGKITSETRTVS